MSEVWNEGYFTDVGYTYGYYREISPVFQRFCLLLKGFAVSEPDSNTAHCELGFGQGVSVNIHAATNPGRYVATDFNPAHAAHANTLALAAGSGALLYDDSFEQLLNRNDLPQFDSISVHGIWTWVSHENHKIISEFARRHLKPGGLFYISYNCFPGWSPAYPLRQMFALHDRFASQAHDAVQRVEAALKFAESLLAANPMYTKTVTGLVERLKGIAQQDRHYLAHEYFNQEWNCMYFTDVVDALAPAKLDFATTAVLLDTVDALNLSAEGITFLNSVDHPLLREQMRDYFVNQQFRKDLYIRGARRLSVAEQREQLMDTRLLLLTPAADVPLKINGALGEATLQEAVYQPVIAAMAAKDHAPKSLKDLARALPEITFAQLVQAIAVLVGTNHVSPCQPENVVRQVRKNSVALNKYFMERSRSGNDISYLASPVTGGGITVGRFQQLFMLALGQEKKQPAEWAQFVWQILLSQGQRILKEGKTLETAEENIAELTLQAQTFADKQLPVMKALQII